ncbi:hypothetical protein T492DRAFT_1061631 [Pavlovales sp. CCMP2436]|nr:hypothetical protein T492DRAFT_1061631 [Pavlovales sp. CCMP2436]
MASPTPKRAARMIIIHDRKLSLEGLPPEPSMYQLAREWLGNNPYKPIYTRPTAFPASSGLQLPPPLPPTLLSAARLSPPKRSRAAEPELPQTRASSELIMEHHIQHARDVRRWVKVQRRAVIDRYRPRLLKLLCGGQGLAQSNMPMPVQPNQLELLPQSHSPASPAQPLSVKPLHSTAVEVAAEAAQATADVCTAAEPGADEDNALAADSRAVDAVGDSGAPGEAEAPSTPPS